MHWSSRRKAFRAVLAGEHVHLTRAQVEVHVVEDPLGTSRHATPLNRTTTPLSPTAHTSDAPLPQMARSPVIEGVVTAAHVVPS